MFRRRSSTSLSIAASTARPLAMTGLAGFALLAFSAVNARADFRVCNATKNLVGVAIGYRASAGWTTEGWWQIPGRSCATLIKGKLSSRYYYVYAEDAGRGGRWGGKIDMCVADDEFKIVGAHNCFARGHQRMGFKEYDTGRQGSWMVQLTEAPDGASGPNAGDSGAQTNGADAGDASAAPASPDDAPQTDGNESAN